MSTLFVKRINGSGCGGGRNGQMDGLRLREEALAGWVEENLNYWGGGAESIKIEKGIESKARHAVWNGDGE